MTDTSTKLHALVHTISQKIVFQIQRFRTEKRKTQGGQSGNTFPTKNVHNTPYNAHMSECPFVLRTCKHRLHTTYHTTPLTPCIETISTLLPPPARQTRTKMKERKFFWRQKTISFTNRSLFLDITIQINYIVKNCHFLVYYATNLLVLYLQQPLI